MTRTPALIGSRQRLTSMRSLATWRSAVKLRARTRPARKQVPVLGPEDKQCMKLKEMHLTPRTECCRE